MDVDPDLKRDNQSGWDHSWQVPQFVTDFWDGRTSHYCVVVPVINEGERIRLFIQRLRSNTIDNSCDVIIADGGSHDGSVDRDFLRSHGVRGLLIKKDSGGLGAQLRIAYAFALAQGYQGIVTIDGNNKDDPAAIPSFVQHLEDGFDFVQASRFIPGGQSINLPTSRWLAIRLIHAPLLSLASGYGWTDTTQGFRAYSSALLRSTKLQIFRSQFEDYELLAFLSAQAPRYGFKCVECPSLRAYPKGSVPTKISIFRGNLSLIKTLAKACLGHYNPRPQRSEAEQTD